MEGITSIIQSVSELDKKYLSIFLSSINEHQSFRRVGNKDIESLFAHLISGLNSPNKRHESLLVLRECLQQCNLDLVEQKATQLVSLCIKICIQKSSTSSIPVAYDILKLLIQKSAVIPELGKSFTGVHVPKVSEIFQNVPPAAYISALECAETCLRLYPGPCKSNRTLIEKFAFKFFESTESHLVLSSGKCLFLLQQIRGSEPNKQPQKSGFHIFQSKLLGSLHEVLDLLYANCPEVYSASEESESLPINISNDLSDEPAKRASQLIIRFQNLITYLQVFLREPYKHSKEIVLKQILNLISRGLGVNCHALEKNPISDNIAVGILLPKLHTTLYKLMDTLILTLKSHMKIHYQTILNLVLNTLKWTSVGKTGGYKKSYIELRSAAYLTLSLWCKTMKNGSCVESTADFLVEQIKNDITPYQTEVKLKVLSGSKKHLSKKARRLLHKAENAETHLSQTHSKSVANENQKIIDTDQDNSELCASALECLKNVILVTACFLKPSVVRDLQETIAVLAIQASECGHSTGNVYRSYLCRKHLYDVLYSLVSAPHHLCPPPTQFATVIFSRAQIHDVNVIVRDVCNIHLRGIEKMLHPQKECFYFPLDIQEVKNIFKRNEPEMETQFQNSVEVIDSNPEEDDHSSDVTIEFESSFYLQNDESVEILDEKENVKRDNHVQSMIDTVSLESNETGENSVQSIVDLDDDHLPNHSKEGSVCENIEEADQVDKRKIVWDDRSDEQNEEPTVETNRLEIESCSTDLQVNNTDNDDGMLHEEPALKKTRLDTESCPADLQENNADNDDDMLGKISSMFVDELRDDNDICS